MVTFTGSTKRHQKYSAFSQVLAFLPTPPVFGSGGKLFASKTIHGATLDAWHELPDKTRSDTYISKNTRMNKYSVALLMIGSLLAVGCNDKQTRDEIMKEVNTKGTITNAQAESLSKAMYRELKLNGLTTITDTQAEILSKVKSLNLCGLSSISDAQAESLNKVDYLKLNGLTTITDEQLESLSKVGFLKLNGLTSITDAQAESLSKEEGWVFLNGLTSITDAQAESLSKVGYLEVPEDLQPLLDKYWNE